MPTQDELNIKYKNNLAIESTTLMARDQFGNISINATDTTRDVLIERINWVFDNPSINKVIETRFSYYKFPPKIKITEVEDVPIDTLVNIDTILGDANTVNIMLKPTTIQQIPTIGINSNSTKATTNRMRYESQFIIAKNEIQAGTSISRYEYKKASYDIVLHSLFEGSFREIDFKIQLDGNPLIQPPRFVFTKDIIQLNKNVYFDISVAISHLDKDGVSGETPTKENAFNSDSAAAITPSNQFVIRLVRYRKKSVTATNPYYEVLHEISHLDLKNCLWWSTQDKASYRASPDKFLQKTLELSINDPEIIAAISNDDEIVSLTKKIEGAQADTAKMLKEIPELEEKIKTANETQSTELPKIQPLERKSADKQAEIIEIYGLIQTAYGVSYQYGVQSYNYYAGTIGIKEKEKQVFDEEIAAAKKAIKDAKEIIETSGTTIKTYKEEKIPKNDQNIIVWTAQKKSRTEYLVSIQELDVSRYDSILSGKYGTLRSGKSTFNMRYSIPVSDVRLYDTYAVEFLACGRDGNETKAELMEDSTYWRIYTTKNNQTDTNESGADDNSSIEVDLTAGNT